MRGPLRHLPPSWWQRRSKKSRIRRKLLDGDLAAATRNSLLDARAMEAARDMDTTDPTSRSTNSAGTLTPLAAGGDPGGSSDPSGGEPTPAEAAAEVATDA